MQQEYEINIHQIASQGLILKNNIFFPKSIKNNNACC